MWVFWHLSVHAPFSSSLNSSLTSYSVCRSFKVRLSFVFFFIASCSFPTVYVITWLCLANSALPSFPCCAFCDPYEPTSPHNPPHDTHTGIACLLVFSFFYIGLDIGIIPASYLLGFGMGTVPCEFTLIFTWNFAMLTVNLMTCTLIQHFLQLLEHATSSDWQLSLLSR